jgi:hypothetical protein
MHALYREDRILGDPGQVTWDLANHIYARGEPQSIVVITNNALGMMSNTKKQWNGLIRQVKRERSSTITASRISELAEQIAWMERISFGHKLLNGELTADITFAPTDTFVNSPPICQTMYVFDLANEAQLALLTSKMRDRTLLVIYRRQS